MLNLSDFAGGHGTLHGLINSFVHIIMYAYYLLAAFGPTVQKYLWWKKYLTTLQMVKHLCVCRSGYNTAYLAQYCVRMYIELHYYVISSLLLAKHCKIRQSHVFISNRVPTVGSHIHGREYSRNIRHNSCEWQVSNFLLSLPVVVFPPKPFSLQTSAISREDITIIITIITIINCVKKTGQKPALGLEEFCWTKRVKVQGWRRGFASTKHFRVSLKVRTENRKCQLCYYSNRVGI